MDAIVRQVRRAREYLAKLLRQSPGPADDPYAYIGSGRKPQQPAGAAGVALEEPRYFKTTAKGRYSKS